MSRSLNETMLLYRAKVKQDPEAFAKLYDQYVKRIYRFVYFKVSSHEEAEDITSEVFLKAWNYLRDNKDIKSFSGLLYRIARNSVIDLYRAKALHGEVLSIYDKDVSEEESLVKATWQQDVAIKIENENLLLVLKKLKQEYQEVITLRYVDELEIDEISEITGKGKIAVRVTLHRAIKKIKTLLKE